MRANDRVLLARLSPLLGQQAAPLLAACRLAPGEDAAEALAQLLAEPGAVARQAAAVAPPAEQPGPQQPAAAVAQAVAAGAAPAAEQQPEQQPAEQEGEEAQQPPPPPPPPPQQQQQRAAAAPGGAPASDGPGPQQQQQAAAVDAEAPAPACHAQDVQDAGPAARKRERIEQLAQDASPQPAAKQRRTQPAAGAAAGEASMAGGDAKRGRGGGLCRWADSNHEGELGHSQRCWARGGRLLCVQQSKDTCKALWFEMRLPLPPHCCENHRCFFVQPWRWKPTRAV